MSNSEELTEPAPLTLLPVGTLVRVRRDTFSDGTGNMRTANRDGLLWVVVDLLRESNEGLQDRDLWLYRCRSIATGTKFLWFRSEFDVAGEQADAEGE